MSECNEDLRSGPAVGGSSSAGDAAEDRQRPQDLGRAPDAGAGGPSKSSDASSESSTSTQWPSAPPSPNSQDDNGNVSRLQDVLDRALRDPFSSHPEVAAHLKSNVKMYCQLAAEKIHEADVLLVVTGAGFSADSGLATYIDVADIEAYRSKGWRYRDLCRPPAFAGFDDFDAKNQEGAREGEGGSVGASSVGEQQTKRQDAPVDESMMEPYEMECKGGSDSENSNKDVLDGELHSEVNLEHVQRGLRPLLLHRRRPALAFRTAPSEDNIHHPQYFYGFWGQCCNDYRRVSPHDGYDIILRWGQDKNFGANCNAMADNAIDERIESDAARDIRRITRMLELGDDGSDNSHDSGSFFRFKEDDEDEPYYVSPNERAGAFFVFTSNVDAHSFDVFKSHEIRECHGNVEMWQCHNFACGTNASVLDGGSLDGSHTGESCEDNKGQEDKWQRRLWRLPMNHHFSVDCNTMQAPRSKTTVDNLAFGCEAFSPASKRRKSSVSDRDESQGKSCSASAHPDQNGGDDNNDTATALGGMMEDALRNHLAIEPEESNHSEAESNGEVNAPAHVGDVHGKPRLFPLRHMNPPNGAANGQGIDTKAQDCYLPIAANENWPRCPRCHEAARPAVLMFDDLDWVYNLKQEQRWERWTQSLLKLCKWRGRGVEGLGSESASTVSDNELSDKGWEDVSEPSTEKKTDQIVDASAPKAPPDIVEEQGNATDEAVDVSSPARPTAIAEEKDTDGEPKRPLRVAILEIGCGYNVPTCRVIAERLTGELAMRGGDATLIRINISHPEADDHEIEDNIISIMEKGLAALKLIDECYRELAN